MAVTTYENNIEYAPFNSVDRDRAINADHLARWLSSVNSDGVTKKFNQLEVKVANGMNVVVDTGIGHVEGHHIYLKSAQTITIETASVSGNRIDTIGFRLETANRKVVLYYKTGDVGTGKAPAVLNNDEYVEIPLCNINVRQSATSILASDLEDVRMYVVSSATYFKRYNQTLTTASVTTTMSITVPFNVETDDVEILVNGIKLLSNQYSIADKTITFNSAIYSGNTIQLNVWHFQDGSGKMNTMNQVVTDLGDLEKVKKYYYFCTGENDNIALSDIAQDFLNGTGEFAGIDAYAQMEVMVCGEMGSIGLMYNIQGSGSQNDPYVYFAFGRASTSTRTIYFNFANCSRITVTAPTNVNYYATIFSGSDINIRNVAVNVVSGYNVDMFNGTNVHVVDSEFWMTTTNDCCVGRCCGYFDKVRTSITSQSGNAFCFYGNGRLLRVIGGDHFAWTANSSKEAIPFYVAANQTENVMHVTMANMPQYARSGYYQSRPIKINHGYATFMMNTMWMVATKDNGSFYDATKCIASGNAIISKN